MTAKGRELGPSRYIPTLDGWRAIAVLLVIAAHGFRSVEVRLGHPLGGVLANGLQQGGQLGVRVFFSLSGFLITSRLLEEEARADRIDLRGFYLRRMFRILPAAYGYLTIIGLLGVLGALVVTPLAFWGAAFFFINYLQSGTECTRHFWSLAVEEHFYLLWPALLVWFDRGRRARGGAILAIAVALWRAADFALGISSPTSAHFLRDLWSGGIRTDLVIDFLLWGSVFGILANQLEWRERFTAHAHRLGCAAAVVIAAVILAPPAHRPALDDLNALVRPLLAGLALAILLTACTLIPRSAAGRLLELAPLRWIGRLSYSLYLWQQVFLSSEISSQPWLAFLQRMPWNLGAVLLMAWLSQRLLEKPLIRLGHRLATWHERPAYDS